MTKKRSEIDIIPFIPARSSAPLMAETLLLFCTALAGVSAALAVLIKQLGCLS